MINSTLIDDSPLLDDDGDAFTNEESPRSMQGDLLSWRSPICATQTYFSNLSSFFSSKFLAWIAVVQLCVSGGARRLTMVVSLPLFKGLGIDASRKQLYMALMYSPFAMKALIGVLSDLFPVRGYNKRYYAVISILVGVLSSSFLLGASGYVRDTISNSQDVSRILCDFIIVCFTGISFEDATLDILNEGKYSELMRISPQSGSSIITYKEGLFTLGSIFTQSYVGPLADSHQWDVLFWILVVLTLMPLYPVLTGWLPENKRSADDAGMVQTCPGLLFDSRSFHRRRVSFLIIALSAFAAPLASVVTTFTALGVGLTLSAFVLVCCALATYIIFPRIMFWTLLAIILIDLSNVNISPALEYYYTADEACLANGPHFDYTYFITVTGIVGCIVNFFGVILYQTFLSGWKFRAVLIFTITIGSVSNATDLVIAMGWNRMIGISDKLFFLFGNAIFDSLTDVLMKIPRASMISKMAPPQMESTVFAFSVGIANFCFMLSRLIGSGVIQHSGMKTVGVDCDFGKLPELIVTVQIILPLVIGIPASFLVPNVFQTDNLINWEAEGWYHHDPPESFENRGSGANIIKDQQLCEIDEERN